MASLRDLAVLACADLVARRVNPATFRCFGERGYREHCQDYR
ncbi:hypothetical protein ACXLRS_000445 [Citrobacter youngae]